MKMATPTICKILVTFLFLDFADSLLLQKKSNLLSALTKSRDNVGLDTVMKYVEDLERSYTSTCQDNSTLLNGLWKTIYSTLGVLQAPTTLDKLSYKSLPNPLAELNTLDLLPRNVYQVVNIDQRRYDNIVDVLIGESSATTKCSKACMLTKGNFNFHDDSEAHKNRLEITFHSLELLPIKYEDNFAESIDESFQLKAGTSEDMDILRKKLNLLSTQQLRKEYDNFKGFSDVTYIDEDLRFMRGNAGNLYILQKVCSS